MDPNRPPYHELRVFGVTYSSYSFQAKWEVLNQCPIGLHICSVVKNLKIGAKQGNTYTPANALGVSLFENDVWSFPEGTKDEVVVHHRHINVPFLPVMRTKDKWLLKFLTSQIIIISWQPCVAENLTLSAKSLQHPYIPLIISGRKARFFVGKSGIPSGTLCNSATIPQLNNTMGSWNILHS